MWRAWVRCSTAASTQATNQDLEIWLTTDKSGLPGKFKAWIYNHGILPQILLAYEVPIIEVRTGRKWRAAEAVDVAESRLRQRVLVGTVAQGRASLGSHRTPRYEKVQVEERRLLILEEVRAGVEEKRPSQMVRMRQQWAWMGWEQAVERKVTLTEACKAEPHQIKFLIQAV